MAALAAVEAFQRLLGANGDVVEAIVQATQLFPEVHFSNLLFQGIKLASHDEIALHF